MQDIVEKDLNNSNKKKACVVTFGCRQNEADSEKIKGMLAALNYELTSEDALSECDVIVVNTCAVREHAELKAFSRTGQLKLYKRENKNLIIGICGCMVEQEHRAEYIKKSFPYVDFLLGTHSLHKFTETLNNALERKNDDEKVGNGGSAKFKSKAKAKRQFVRVPDSGNAEEKIKLVEDLPIYRESKYIANVSVMYGCNNFCSYCVVPYVRGRERSRKRSNILKEVRGLIADGCKDITLLGQNVNSYKSNEPVNGEIKECNFTKLLSDITETDGDFLIRFITSHPKDVPNSLIELMAKNNKIANHFHLPVQSGSNRILKLMNRGYTREYYLEVVEKLRRSAGGISITTDIIVGFPTETDEDFDDTMNIIETVGFDNIFAFIYSKRKGTPAAEMADDISKEVKNKRFERLIRTQNEISLKKNQSYEGKIVRALVEGRYKNARDSEEDASKMAARTSDYKLVLYDGDVSQTGTFVDLRIKEGRLAFLAGELI